MNFLKMLIRVGFEGKKNLHDALFQHFKRIYLVKEISRLYKEVSIKEKNHLRERVMQEVEK